VVEPQRRGLAHFHVLIVVRPDEDGHLLEGTELLTRLASVLPTPRSVRAARVRDLGDAAAATFRDGPTAAATDGTGVVLAFGTESDVRLLAPLGGTWAGVASYLAKYLTKTTGGMGLDLAAPRSPLAAHLDRLGDLAEARAKEYWPARHGGKAPRTGDLTRVRRSLGYSGPPRSTTRGYGTTLTELKAAAAALHQPDGPDVDVPEWVPVWAYRSDLTTDLRRISRAAAVIAARAP